MTVETEPTPGDLWWHEHHPDRSIDPTSYHVSAEARALAHHVCDTLGITHEFIVTIDFVYGEAIVHRYLANAEGKRYVIVVDGERTGVVAQRTDRYPWPPT